MRFWQKALGINGFRPINTTQVFLFGLDKIGTHAHNENRPFYSCVLSYLAMNASEAGGDLALIQTFKLFSCKCQLVSMRTT